MDVTDDTHGFTSSKQRGMEMCSLIPPQRRQTSAFCDVTTRCSQLLCMKLAFILDTWENTQFRWGDNNSPQAIVKEVLF